MFFKLKFRFFSKKLVLKKPSPIILLGKHYNLQEIFNQVNHLYFDGKIDVQITWFGNEKRSARRKRILGLYDVQSKLIKIHRLLDHPNFPPYFISYVVYHEMLHHVYPPHQVRRGRRKIHHADFKRQEQKFAEYSQVKQWEKENRQIFFQGR